MSLAAPEKFTDYTRPPLVERVFGVMWRPVSQLSSVHLGLIWGRLKDLGFAKYEDKPPILIAAQETFDSKPAGVSIQVSNVPELPRVWFTSADGFSILQLQRDRFHYNHRRERPEDPYIDYGELATRFDRHLSTMEGLLHEATGATPVETQYELSYINTITSGTVWTSLADLGEVLPDLPWGAHSFLGTPEAVSAQYSFQFPDKRGRLYAKIQSGNDVDGKPALQFQLVARGGPASNRGGRADWFNLAHKWIVRSFDDMTHPQMQQLWGKKGA